MGKNVGLIQLVQISQGRQVKMTEITPMILHMKVRNATRESGSRASSSSIIIRLGRLFRRSKIARSERV